MKQTFPTLIFYGIQYAIINYLEKSWPEWLNYGDEAIKKASNAIGTAAGNTDACLHGYNAVNGFVQERHQRGYKTYPVRIPTALLLECYSGTGLEEREIRVLAGVVSALGEKRYVNLGWKRIQCRAAGYLPPEYHKYGPGIYTHGQIERALLKLRERGLLTVFSYGKGHAGERWWAHGKTPIEDLARIVVAKKNKAALMKQNAAAISKAYSERVLINVTDPLITLPAPSHEKVSTTSREGPRERPQQRPREGGRER